MINRAYISLGSNIGNKEQNVSDAVLLIARTDGIRVCRKSSLYITAPWGKTDQEDFVNQVIEIETERLPLDLLHVLQEIEIKLGRLRIEKWGPRKIDLDILLYGQESIHLQELIVPHPYMFERLFVLIPLQEIEPELVFPDGSRIKEVLDRVSQQEEAEHSILKLQSL